MRPKFVHFTQSFHTSTSQRRTTEGRTVGDFLWHTRPCSFVYFWPCCLFFFWSRFTPSALFSILVAQKTSPQQNFLPLPQSHHTVIFFNSNPLVRQHRARLAKSGKIDKKQFLLFGLLFCFVCLRSRPVDNQPTKKKKKKNYCTLGPHVATPNA